MISIIDYGMGNLRSVAKAFELYHDNVRIINTPKDILKSKALVLPGDGAFAMAMENLEEQGWLKPLKEYIAGDNYFMGICLGYQLLFTRSCEFGDTDGLGLIEGDVIKFDDTSLKVPHMGWNQVKLHGNSKFMKGIPDNSYFYFIHSFHPSLNDNSWLIGSAEYGIEFPCIVGKNNIIATQFHPEKSHKFGLKIIENFVKESAS